MDQPKRLLTRKGSSFFSPVGERSGAPQGENTGTTRRKNSGDDAQEEGRGRLLLHVLRPLRGLPLILPQKPPPASFLRTEDCHHAACGGAARAGHAGLPCGWGPVSIATRAGRCSTLFVSGPIHHIWGIQVRGCVGIGVRLIQASGDTISRPSRAARLATFKTARSREINVVGASDARCRPRSMNF